MDTMNMKEKPLSRCPVDTMNMKEKPPSDVQQGKSPHHELKDSSQLEKKEQECEQNHMLNE